MRHNISANLADRANELLGNGAPTDVEPKPLLDLEDDTPLAPACDLSGEGSCGACQ